jgi:hypothetical protein
MRCCSCNENLNDYESTLRSKSTGLYLDMCRKCLKGLDIKTMPNMNDPDEPVPDDEHYWDYVYDEVDDD